MSAALELNRALRGSVNVLVAPVHSLRCSKVLSNPELASGDLAWRP